MRYVLCFAFTPSSAGVIMLKKRRPAWQAGLLNAPGGKIEPGELALAAAVREFREETAIQTAPEQWFQFGRHIGEDYTLDLFSTILTTEQCQEIEMTTDEEPLWRSVDGMTMNDPEYVPGAVIYAGMALNHHRRFVTKIQEAAKRQITIDAAVWDEFLRDYTRYDDGDACMPFTQLRYSLDGVIGNAKRQE